MHVVGFETLDRLNRAVMIWHNEPPKLSALGFDYPPLATLLIAPLAVFSSLAASLLVVPVDLSDLRRAHDGHPQHDDAARLRSSTPLRYAVLLALGANPLVALYASTGARQFMWLSLVVVALGALFAWYVTADIRFVMIAGPRLLGRRPGRLQQPALVRAQLP